jgi:hypothetical protein
MDDFTFIVCHSWKIKIAFENDKSTWWQIIKTIRI